MYSLDIWVSTQLPEREIQGIIFAPLKSLVQFTIDLKNAQRVQFQDNSKFLSHWAILFSCKIEQNKCISALGPLKGYQIS